VTLEPHEEFPYKDQILDMVKDYYLHPYEVLKTLPQEQYHFVYYDQLMENPEACVQEIYDDLGFMIYPGFKRRLRRIIRRQQKYQRPREYSLKKMGLNAKRIFEIYKSVFIQFKISPISGVKIKVKQKDRFLPFVKMRQGKSHKEKIVRQNLIGIENT